MANMANMVLTKARLIMVATALALALVIGSISAVGEAQARPFDGGSLGYTITHKSSDGKLTLVCVYDDNTGELLYCDVYWL
jgi:hypothetical protein